MYLLHALRVLDHLHLGDIIRPCLVPEERSDLAAQFEGLVEQGDVDRQAAFVAFLGALAGGGVFGVFELVKT